MQTVSPSIDERARKNLTLILRTLAEVTQVKVAELIGVHESSISRLKGEDFARIASIIAALGLQLVPGDMEMWDGEYIANLRKVLAAELALSRKPDTPFG